jgi:ribosome-associated protein YbcJ (S4-like RNA binding protein)
LAKLIISRDTRVIQEVELDDGPMIIGRQPNSDIVIAHQAVSGRHAQVATSAGETWVEDLGSSNGTFVNGQRINRARLADGDRVTVATFQLEYLAGAPLVETHAEPQVGRIDVLNGPSAGKTLALLKPLTTLGSPGVLAVAITRQHDGDYIAQVKGDAVATINDEAITRTPRLLRDGDLLEVTRTRMRYIAQS